MSSKRALALVGGGHANIEVLRRFAENPTNDFEIALYDPSPSAWAAMMVAGVIAGHYKPAQARTNLWALCQRARARFIEASVTRIDADAQRVETNTGQRHRYDLVSVNVGSSVRSLPVSEGAFVVATRPPEGLMRTILERESVRNRSTLHVRVIGGGVQGVETALALAWRWRQHPQRKISIVTRKELLRHYSNKVRRAAFSACARLGVEVLEGANVRQIDPSHLVLASGEHLETHLSLLATGSMPPPLLSTIAATHSADGSIAVTPFLQSQSHPSMFASGDCATIIGQVLPKSVEYAIQQGPILYANLLAAAAEKQMPEQFAQKKTSQYISLGDQQAIYVQGGLSFSGQWMWRRAEALHQKWVSLYAMAD